MVTSFCLLQDDPLELDPGSTQLLARHSTHVTAWFNLGIYRLILYLHRVVHRILFRGCWSTQLLSRHSHGTEMQFTLIDPCGRYHRFHDVMNRFNRVNTVTGGPFSLINISIGAKIN